MAVEYHIFKVYIFVTVQEADLIFAAITITSQREEAIDFTYQYWHEMPELLSNLETIVGFICLNLYK